MVLRLSFYCFSLFFLAACSSGGGDSVEDPVVDTRIEIPPSLSAASSAFLFDYTMPAVTGGSATARSFLFEPNQAVPADGHSLVVWAHGTTGIANDCAPSLDFENSINTFAVNQLLGAGYAVLVPDYEGFGTPTIHPYYLRDSHANSVLFAVPAAHQIPGTNLSDDWAIVGHSQGGHVALATARGEANPAYPLQAVVALAPGTDLVPLSDRAFEAIDFALAEGEFQEAVERVFFMNVYSAYIAHAFALVEPEFDPRSLFGNAVAPLIDIAVDETDCGQYVDAVIDELNAFVTGGGNLPDFAGLQRDWSDIPALANRLQFEEMGDEAQPAPLLVVQGDADRQIPVAGTTAFVDRQRSVGTDVSYEIVEGGRHGDVSRGEFGRTLNWLATRFPAQ